MGRVRYRKSIRVPGGFRVNVSSKGVGYSWGVKGMRFTQRADGRVTRTLSIPGTGLSKTDVISPSHRQAPQYRPPSQPFQTPSTSPDSTRYLLAFCANTLAPGAGFFFIGRFVAALVWLFLWWVLLKGTGIGGAIFVWVLCQIHLGGAYYGGLYGSGLPLEDESDVEQPELGRPALPTGSSTPTFTFGEPVFEYTGRVAALGRGMAALNAASKVWVTRAEATTGVKARASLSRNLCSVRLFTQPDVKAPFQVPELVAPGVRLLFLPQCVVLAETPTTQRRCCRLMVPG